MKPTTLPPPDPAALELSGRLAADIEAEIRTEGPISLERFWERALYAPGLGYYNNGSRKFGADGDFVTAPELGTVFGRCLARALAEVLDGFADGGRILELGGGTGQLAATLLEQLAARGATPAEYAILDVSADLKQRQRDLLVRRCPQWLDRVRWLDTPPREGWHGVLLANEVVDALPARRYRHTGGAWVERRIGAADGGFEWVDRPAAAADQQRLKRLLASVGQEYPEGYETEFQPHLAAWVESVSERLREGLALFVDYGYPRPEYYHPQRGAGTLMAHYRHRAHEDVLAWPGLQDLSVNVDFTALAEAVEAAGLHLLGYTSQARFLLGSGLAEIVAEAEALDGRARARLLHEVKLLTLPSEMGERFQLLAAGRGLEQAPVGFDIDWRHRL